MGSTMTGGAKSRSLELFFIEGRPDGMLTAEVFNWTGHVLMTPRTQFGEALKRTEAEYTGIYLLFGEREDGTPLAYIGEAEAVGKRIRDRDSNNDWCNSAILITSAGNKLNKAHVRYLEARLITVARGINKINLENGTTPPIPKLSEAAQANMEAFLENILMVLPALRVDTFIKGVRPEPASIGESESISGVPFFELRLPKRDIYATAKQVGGEFVVQAGSITAKLWETSGSENYARLFAELVKTGTLQERGEHHRVFTENYAFTSVSAAASVVTGHPTSGPLAWKVKGQQMTYKQWEAEKLARDSPRETSMTTSGIDPERAQTPS